MVSRCRMLLWGHAEFIFEIWKFWYRPKFLDRLDFLDRGRHETRLFSQEMFYTWDEQKGKRQSHVISFFDNDKNSNTINLSLLVCFDRWHSCNVFIFVWSSEAIWSMSLSINQKPITNKLLQQKHFRNTNIRSLILYPCVGRGIHLGRVSNNQNGNLRWFLPWRGGRVSSASTLNMAK